MEIHNFKLNQMKKSGNLTNDLAASLRNKIITGNLQVGAKLPSSKIVEELAGVSRSVVREAIAQLRAEGLVESRQGVGVFISKIPEKNAFKITQKEMESITDAIQILELRMAVEVEMSGMAAKFRTEEQMTTINNCLLRMSKKMSIGKDGIDEDFNFHKAIAVASGNIYFLRFIDYIGSRVIIPAREIVTSNKEIIKTDDFLDILNAEHKQIAKAIEYKDPELARAATKAHLTNSIARHQKARLIS
ncbi:FadR/GntR family transcriptional regulator [Pseudocolwellia agarivorans]|uniref:FadR/GntR family transcriptional regulator n=1 Tax=Pseudocolwellia agarivorans TaxID=1911682 RepID=UPI00158CBE6E|nr:FadR/GntR family transcriptional regulator [Pseudocolwellia agarivorans]